MKEQTWKAGRDGRLLSMRNQHTTVLLSPSGKESSKQNPRHPLTSMEQKLSGISEEVPQHGAMKAVCFQILRTLPWIFPAVLTAEHDPNTPNPSCIILH